MINDDLGKMGDPNGNLTSGGIPAFLPTDNRTGNAAIPEDSTFHWLEEPATFMGDFPKWVAQHLRYPSEPASMGVEGKVFVQFVINKHGNVENAIVARSSSDLALDAEALRVIKSSPVWIPGKQTGKPVKQQFTVPIIFKLSRNN
jgi:protein TonB